MAIVTCNQCQRENEIPDDEVCPGYSELIDALKVILPMITTEWNGPLQEKAKQALAKAGVK